MTKRTLMCGYIGNLHESPAVLDLFNRLGLPLPYPIGQSYMMRTAEGLVTPEEDAYRVGPATWWYAMKWLDGKLVPNTEITSFNARNLTGRMWRKPINERRGLVFATEIGETQGRVHYLMQAKEALAIGTVYQTYQTDEGPVRSFALITRPAHPRFAKYHEKAMPLFLPLNAGVLEHWLNPAVPADDADIAQLLNSPTITTDLTVTPVKTFKRAEPVGEPELLARDLM